MTDELNEISVRFPMASYRPLRKCRPVKNLLPFSFLNWSLLARVLATNFDALIVCDVHRNIAMTSAHTVIFTAYFSFTFRKVKTFAAANALIIQTNSKASQPFVRDRYSDATAISHYHIIVNILWWLEVDYAVGKPYHFTGKSGWPPPFPPYPERRSTIKLSIFCPCTPARGLLVRH